MYTMIEEVVMHDEKYRIYRKDIDNYKIYKQGDNGLFDVLMFEGIFFDMCAFCLMH